jgi:hypothetical protein
MELIFARTLTRGPNVRLKLSPQSTLEVRNHSHPLAPTAQVRRSPRNAVLIPIENFGLNQQNLTSHT